MIIIYIAFLWAVFSGIFFLKNDSTIWNAPNSLIAGFHYFIDLLLIGLLFLKIQTNLINLKEIKNRWIFIIFFFSILISTVLNYVNLYDTLRFILTVISPIIIYLILVYDKRITYKQIKNAFLFYILICITQYFIAIYKNYNLLLRGIIIIDDFFRGTMGAYQFVFLLNLYSFYTINKFIILGRINILEGFLTILFILAFIMSGAGGYLLLFFIALLFNILINLSFNRKKTKLIIYTFPVFVFSYFIISYFLSNYALAQAILKSFTYVGLSNNPKIFFTLQALQPILNPLNFIFGLGSGQYLSGIGGNPNASYFGGILLDQMGSSAYAVNSDSFAFLSEIGLIGIISFYLLIYILIIKRTIKYTISNKEKLYQMTLLGAIIYALLLSIQYRIFIFFVSSYVLWFFLGIIKRKLLMEEYNKRELNK